VAVTSDSKGWLRKHYDHVSVVLADVDGGPEPAPATLKPVSWVAGVGFVEPPRELPSHDDDEQPDEATSP
jgi:hypothetical protein